ncbi:MAG: hypothetical protein DCC49_13885 [Acidobacteria bacterium]|nr:MAG: hypothetical protein DCC49_13885 [Acidobacteriota bacterium]
MASAGRRAKRKFTAQQKLEIVIAGIKGEKSVQDVCREHEITASQYYQWRDKLLEGGKAALSGAGERQTEKELKKKIRDLERTLGKKTHELELAGELLRDWE